MGVDPGGVVGLVGGFCAWYPIDGNCIASSRAHDILFACALNCHPLCCRSASSLYDFKSLHIVDMIASTCESRKKYGFPVRDVIA